MDFDDWRELPAQPTLFCYLDTDGHGHSRRLAAQARRVVLERVTAWVLEEPEAALVISVDGADHEHVEAAAVALVAEPWTAEQVEQLSIAATRSRPRRARFVNITYGGILSAQMVGAAEQHAETALTELLRHLAPLSRYAYARLATPTFPTEDDTRFALRRPPTRPEEVAAIDRSYAMTPDRVMGLYPLQLVASQRAAELEAADELGVERLGDGRALVRVTAEAAWSRLSLAPVEAAEAHGWREALIAR